MSGIVGFVFIITMLNCIAGAVDQIVQRIKRWWEQRKAVSA